MTDSHPFKGSFPYKTDSKTRVTVTAAWRPAAGEPLNVMKSLCDKVPILKVMTNAQFEERLRTIERNTTSPAEIARKKTRLVRLIREVSVNDQGKMLIPKELADHAGIAPDSEVTLSAGDSHFEIWRREDYERTIGLTAVPEEEDDLGIF